MQDYEVNVDEEMKVAIKNLEEKPTAVKRKEIYLYGSINMTAISLANVQPIMPIFGV